ncbi:MAG: GrpB family protein [Methylacidiphilales bacterium]|nr:GrpB family protein [Candidatus Methylacidiphilales bacterium]NJR14889.1 GrpB family protein [Calothrix sp. CSU_2_0]
MRKIEVVAHNPHWKQEFERESKLVADALGNNVITVHHIGSTSIPNIYAKPIIDMLVEVANIDQVDAFNLSMIALGYEVMGEFGIPGRRFFRKDINQIRTHHIHTFKVDSYDVNRHLAFRDYMILHPEYAQKYSDLKQDLAKKFPNDIQSYMDGKNGFIKDMEKHALAWRESQAG